MGDGHKQKTFAQCGCRVSRASTGMDENGYGITGMETESCSSTNIQSELDLNLVDC